MRSVIIGTAGHIDHGKTALVKALTGIECDTHPNEKRRGITINLGFAKVTFPSGDMVSIIDVPGHHDFIHTMVAGASGIDIALVVIAADSGVMPQTREHLSILTALGIGAGVIALTRIDLVEHGKRVAVGDEIKTFVAGTFLEQAPCISVSSVTGEGIEELRSVLQEQVRLVDKGSTSDLFRLYIDRIFSVSGFGTVVTGSVLGGTVATGAMLHLLPGDKTVRIRRLERHGVAVSSVSGGDRASCNVVGLAKEEYFRGMLLADRPLRQTTQVDAQVKLFKPGNTVNLWSQPEMLLGTYEAQVRMHLIDADRLEPGERAVVQLHLPTPCVAQTGDRFVLRTSSGDCTIGGGIVIDPAPLHHRRRPAKLVEKLHRCADGDLAELIALEIDKHPKGVSRKALAERFNVTEGKITLHETELSGQIATVPFNRDMLYMQKSALEMLKRQVRESITAYHHRNPLNEQGRTVEELLGSAGWEPGESRRSMLEQILLSMEHDGSVKRVHHTWASAEHSPDAPHGYEELVTAFDRFLSEKGLTVPLFAELVALAAASGVNEYMTRQIADYLVKKRCAYLCEGAYMHASVVDSVRTQLLEALDSNDLGLTVAQFRDLIGGNRKICLLLYAQFDHEGITRRDGDVRVLTDRGKAMLTNK